MTYRAPVAEMLFALRHVAGLDAVLAASPHGELGPEDAEAILSEAGKVADGVIAPLNRVGDRHGATLSDGAITTAPGWRAAYQTWIEAAGMASAPIRIMAARACLCCSAPPATRCGTPPT